MGTAGKALKQVLASYGISQNKLAIAMGDRRSNVSRWVNEERDPTAETLLAIREGLQKLNPEAAQEFVRLYLGNGGEENEA
jgi:transcriptional regulator with XRE-family HTH domain